MTAICDTITPSESCEVKLECWNSVSELSAASWHSSMARSRYGCIHCGTCVYSVDRNALNKSPFLGVMLLYAIQTTAHQIRYNYNALRTPQQLTPSYMPIISPHSSRELPLLVVTLSRLFRLLSITPSTFILLRTSTNLYIDSRWCTEAKAFGKLCQICMALGSSNLFLPKSAHQVCRYRRHYADCALSRHEDSF